MPYELESELELELEGAYRPGLEWEEEEEWERSLGCPYEARLKLDPIKPKGLTLGRIQCPRRNTAFPILSAVVASAVRMLDNTIGELVRAREAACSGKPLGWPNLGDLTACWLKYRLGVCIDDISAWTKGSVRKAESEPTPVAEVIRRLVQPRNLIANDAITYRCEKNDRGCRGANAFTLVPDHGTPPSIIHLCPSFWIPGHARFREQTIIHELVHLTHSADDFARAASIGAPECLAQFVVATNGKELDPCVKSICGFTNRCGQIPKECACCGKPKKCGAVSDRRPLPDWRPKR